MELIHKYFPDLSTEQYGKLEKLVKLTEEWNTMVNLVSRKDIEHFVHHHLLHSMVIAKYIGFKPGSEVLDLGTGGGLPGLPLAILYPETNFYLIDARAKKINAVKDMVERIGLDNVQAHHGRVEELKGVTFDFVVSRAVAPLETLFNWSQRLMSEEETNSIPNGLITLKGGDISEEIKPLRKRSYVEVVPVMDFFKDDWFDEKYVVYVQR